MGKISKSSSNSQSQSIGSGSDSKANKGQKSGKTGDGRSVKNTDLENIMKDFESIDKMPEAKPKGSKRSRLKERLAKHSDGRPRGGLFKHGDGRTRGASFFSRIKKSEDSAAESMRSGSEPLESTKPESKLEKVKNKFTEPIRAKREAQIEQAKQDKIIDNFISDFDRQVTDTFLMRTEAWTGGKGGEWNDIDQVRDMTVQVIKDCYNFNLQEIDYDINFTFNKEKKQALEELKGPLFSKLESHCQKTLNVLEGYDKPGKGYVAKIREEVLDIPKSVLQDRGFTFVNADGSDSLSITNEDLKQARNDFEKGLKELKGELKGTGVDKRSVNKKINSLVKFYSKEVGSIKKNLAKENKEDLDACSRLMGNIGRELNGALTEMGFDRKSVESLGNSVSEELNDFLIKDLGFSKSEVKGFKKDLSGVIDDASKAIDSVFDEINSFMNDLSDELDDLVS